MAAVSQLTRLVVLELVQVDLFPHDEQLSGVVNRMKMEDEDADEYQSESEAEWIQRCYARGMNEDGDDDDDGQR